MNRASLEHSIRSVVAVSRAGFLAATVAAAIVAHSAAGTAALAQQPGPVAQQRDEAPIVHQQPRIQDLPPSVVPDEPIVHQQPSIQDLPPSVVQDEKKREPELDAIAKELEKLDNRICPGC